MKRLIKLCVILAVFSLSSINANAQYFAGEYNSGYYFPTEEKDTIKMVSIMVDSLQIPQSFIDEGLTPSHYMKCAANSRLVSLLSAAAGGAIIYYITDINKNKAVPNTDAVIITGVMSGLASLTAYIFALSYDYKASKAMSNIKFTGNGVSISF